MASCFQRFPDEMIESILGHVSDPGCRSSLVSAARTCKRLSNIALPILYRNIDIDSNPDVLIPLGERLMRSPELAQRVHHLRCVGDDDEYEASSLPSPHFMHLFCESFRFWDVPQSEYHYWETLLAHHAHKGTLLSIIGLSCPALRTLTFSSVLGRTRDDLDEPVRIFRGKWRWKHLETISIQFDSEGDYGEGESVALVLEELLSRLSSGATLNHLSLVNLSAGGLQSLTEELGMSSGISSRISNLELADVVDIENRGWQTIIDLVSVCTALEYLTVSFRLVSPQEIIPNYVALCKALEHHQHSFKNFTLSFKEYAYELESGHPWQATGSNFTNKRGLWTPFTKLTWLEIPVSLLFGQRAFFETFESAGNVGDLTMLTNHVGERFQSLINQELPASIRVLIVRADDERQLAILKAAMSRTLTPSQQHEANSSLEFVLAGPGQPWP